MEVMGETARVGEQLNLVIYTFLVWASASVAKYRD